MKSWLHIGKDQRRAKKVSVCRRYLGIEDLTFHGVVFAPERPDMCFHVGLVDPAGEILFATRADKKPLKGDFPEGRGFSLPVPYGWLTPFDTPHLFQFRILETGEMFPDKPRELPIERLLRASNRKTQKGAAALARLERVCDEIATTAGSKTLVAGTHNMSRTGAPMILLEIIKQLKERHGYDTVLLSLEAVDSLAPEFEKHCLAVIDNLAEAFRTSRSHANASLASLANSLNSPIALINSLCSTRLAEACGEAGFDVRSLVHEYPHAFDPDWTRRHLEVANGIVLPCDDVHESFVAGGYASDSPAPDNPQFSILAQGCYLLEKPPIDPDKMARSNAAFRQENHLEPGDRLVVSCGTLDSRKGFDWFVSLVRSYAKTSPAAATTHFLWVGAIGEHSLLFHALHDLRREGHIARFHHLDEVEDVRFALASADVFLLCSRIDPFPSVVLESFMMGVPVIGFDTGQGSREMIRETGFGTVVPYQDVPATARAIDDLAGASWKRQRVEKLGPDFVRERFLYTNYVDALAGWLFEEKPLPAAGVKRSKFSLNTAPADTLPPIILVGFHRSGTSYLSRFLDSLGVNMSPSKRFLEGGKGNPDGHFEDLAVLEHHCTLMQIDNARFMHRWGGKHCIFLPDYDTDWDTFAPETRALHDHIAQAKPWGWKDPRSLLFLKMWDQAIGRSLKVFALRHPLDIFLSLLRRATDPYFFTNPLAFFDAYEGYHQHAVADFERAPEDWFVMPMPPRADSLHALRSFLGERLSTELHPGDGIAEFDAKKFHTLDIPTHIETEFRRHFPETATIHDTFDGAEKQAPAAATASPPSPEERLAWLAATYATLLGENFDLYQKLQEGLLTFRRRLSR